MLTRNLGQTPPAHCILKKIKPEWVWKMISAVSLCPLRLRYGTTREWISCMWRNYRGKCKCLSWISIIQWIHSSFLRNNSFLMDFPDSPLYIIFMDARNNLSHCAMWLILLNAFEVLISSIFVSLHFIL